MCLLLCVFHSTVPPGWDAGFASQALGHALRSLPPVDLFRMRFRSSSSSPFGSGLGTPFLDLAYAGRTRWSSCPSYDVSASAPRRRTPDIALRPGFPGRQLLSGLQHGPVAYCPPIQFINHSETPSIAESSTQASLPPPCVLRPPLFPESLFAKSHDDRMPRRASSLVVNPRQPPRRMLSLTALLATPRPSPRPSPSYIRISPGAARSASRTHLQPGLARRR